MTNAVKWYLGPIGVLTVPAIGFPLTEAIVSVTSKMTTRDYPWLGELILLQVKDDDVHAPVLAAVEEIKGVSGNEIRYTLRTSLPEDALSEND